MDYNETLDWLYRQLPMFSRVGAAAYKPGLETSHRLDAHFGHPHRQFKTIHVGGTNGKGSCSHTLAAILQAAGYRTGLYTSPHLVDFRERMRIDGEMIPKEKVTEFVERYIASGYEGHPSFFELTMMMAFDWFASEKVDVAVIEVGMGGRLDSTNIITPEMSVITNVSKDHTQFLGNTPAEIASEKAGIMKPGVKVVIGEAEGEVLKVFNKHAGEVDCPVLYAWEQMEGIEYEHNREKGGWDVTVPPETWYGDPEASERLWFPLEGDYQKANIRTIVTAALSLADHRQFKIDWKHIAKGAAEVCSMTGLAGRWMRLQKQPEVIADTGHNEAGLRYNMHQLQEMMAGRQEEARLRIVLGFVADKDVDHIIRLFPKDAEYYLTQAAIPRALPVEQLAVKAAEAGLQGGTYDSVAEAYAAALKDAAADDLVYVGGSTFVVADLLASLR